MTKKSYCTGWHGAPANINTCCHQHDRDYGIKGKVSRAEADRRLRHCLISQGYPIKAWVFWVLVRMFGWIYYKKEKYIDGKQ
ncbi:hypothetical protein [Pasteurella multocida]|uniref:hypothetical protein n=1 Tax=Pasteurella multocida TaxID=747 RepID=UPI0009A0C4C6|nr:hypothetical protein [Pasteurella multocida]MCW4599967.1 DUF1353 domain-containing protein [Pasteurella multocida subsp. multocida]NNI15519.1 hypothetical protein [Pasteurella multocida]NNI37889.1 hypothetical protein [Pasteurella multocida]NNI43395.1 hypothetical protein [Pasteurella multocida]NNI50746.1 hypothetical protein [Pasteurella multocida]